MEPNLKVTLRRAVRFFYDCQRLRIQTDGRTKPKAQEMEMEGADLKKIAGWASQLASMEEDANAYIEETLQQIPFYAQVLAKERPRYKCIGPAMGGVLLSEIDISKAATVSALWARSGVGMERLYDVEYKIGEKGRTKHVQTWATSQPQIPKIIPCEMEKRPELVVLSAVLVDGHPEPQRKREGQLPSFDTFLRVKLCGVLGGLFLRLDSPYKEFYYNYRQRKDSTIGSCMLCGGSGKYPKTSKKKCGNCDGTGQAPWGKSDKHRHQAAIRYMVKMFLKDLYVDWRTFEGLPVRPPYQEEYLGHEHEEAVAYK